MDTGFIDHEKIYSLLREAVPPDQKEVEDILAHARELQGLDFEEAERLLLVEDEDAIEAVFETAGEVKREIYGKRLVLFAPLYISNICCNDCLYCAFRKSNTGLERRTLSPREIAGETRTLADQGHKRLLLVAGDTGEDAGLESMVKAMETVYGVKTAAGGEIRRVNVNMAPLPVAGFERLKAARIGTYQLFQESYHYDTYRMMHPLGPKSDYGNHLTAMDRAMSAGIDDVGVGILFGLYDYRFEIMALLQHIRHLEERFGIGPHTISVPRLEPARASLTAHNPPHPVGDRDFLKIIAILRMTVPYTGMILSTRETPGIRHRALDLGISQVSAGSRTDPGGYSGQASVEQFSLGDHRSLEEVIQDITSAGYIPSFCTGCYRMGRTGRDFMDLAKPGLIKHYCLPNALTSFQEYLVQYAGPKTLALGEAAIREMTAEIPGGKARKRTCNNLVKVRQGQRDVFI